MKKNLPKIAAGLIITLLTLLFFWKILLTNLILIGVDAFLYFAPYKAYATEVLRQGRLPLWNPYLFMGAPLLANSQVGIFYAPNWLFLWLDAPQQIAWSIGLHITLAGLLMLAYTRLSLHLRWPGALTAAILFAFGGYLGAQVEHINQLNAAAWLPLLFLFYDFGLNQRQFRPWFWFLLLAIVVALTLLAGHAQTVFISLFGLGLYALWRAIEEFFKLNHTKPNPLSLSFIFHPSSFAKQGVIPLFARYLWPLIIVSLLAAALAAPQLIPTAELSSLSIRSGGLPLREVISFSLSPTTLHYALLPPLGGVDLTHVWDEAFSERVAYLGVSGLILALLGSLSAVWQRDARRYMFLAVSGVVLSLGIYSGIYLALYYLPGFDLFRVPPRWLLLYAFSAAILAGYGFNALLTPTTTRNQLTRIWHWLRTRRHFFFLLGLPPLLFLTLLAWKTPPLLALALWSTCAIATLGLMYGILRFTLLPSLLSPLLLLLIIGELFWAAQSLNYNHPTAPQAYHSLRNSVAYLRAAANTTPPDRFLSLSGTTYDPGDLPDLKQIFAGSLSPRGFYQLIVATKQKEVLAYNLPLIYHLPSVDGYDGGVLPLTPFIKLQELFLPPGHLSLDGRLRENLRFVPSSRLLSLLNTRWIITDKVFDAWIDGIFYDLQFPAYLDPGQSIATSHIPTFPATAIGVVSHLQEAAHVTAHTPVAELNFTLANGSSESFTLKAGVDTAEGHYPAGAAHPPAAIGAAWPYRAEGVDYVSVYSLNNRQPIVAITATNLMPAGRFVLKGLSLINQPTTTSRSVVLSTAGNYRQVHSGDVKIYENEDVLPRAFIVHQTNLVAGDEEAIAAMRGPTFDPRQTMVRVAQPGESPGLVSLGSASATEQATIVIYEAERVQIEAKLNSPGWLVLTDTHYPGWQVDINGQPARLLPVNIMFRGVQLPAGKNTVQFEFKPRSLQRGLWISGIALLILTIGLIINGKSRQER